MYNALDVLAEAPLVRVAAAAASRSELEQSARSEIQRFAVAMRLDAAAAERARSRGDEGAAMETARTLAAAFRGHLSTSRSGSAIAEHMPTASASGTRSQRMRGVEDDEAASALRRSPAVELDRELHGIRELEGRLHAACTVKSVYGAMQQTSLQSQSQRWNRSAPAIGVGAAATNAALASRERGLLQTAHLSHQAPSVPHQQPPHKSSALGTVQCTNEPLANLLLGPAPRDNAAQ